MRTVSLTQEKQGGLYQNKVNPSLTFLQSPGQSISWLVTQFFLFNESEVISLVSNSCSHKHLVSNKLTRVEFPLSVTLTMSELLKGQLGYLSVVEIWPLSNCLIATFFVLLPHHTALQILKKVNLSLMQSACCPSICQFITVVSQTL